jgi:hypothetical protein
MPAAIWPFSAFVAVMPDTMVARTIAATADFDPIPDISSVLFGAAKRRDPFCTTEMNRT